MQNARGDGADKMNVVTNKDERPVILLERADEGINRADIEMCHGLVHEQKGVSIAPNYSRSAGASSVHRLRGGVQSNSD